MTGARFMKVCLDANDTAAVGSFWAAALGLAWRPAPHGEGGVYLGERCLVWVNRVPEPKTVKHRIHLDIYTRAIAHLEALGSTLVRPEGDERVWTVMTDPEGGEYCAFLRDDLPQRRLHGIVVDCADPERQARWWGEVFGVEAVATRHGYTLENVPDMPILTMDFGSVPERKAVKNRLHWDVAVRDVQPLLGAGATMRTPHHDAAEWDVLADPEGNEFCAFVRP